MKKLFILVVLCLCLGCASFKVNPSTGEVTYRRFGTQKISGLEVEKDKDKVSVKVESLENTGTEETNAAIRALIKLLPTE